MNSKSKWNKKYQERVVNLPKLTPNGRLTNLSPYLKGGLALDLACGLGANSLFLAQSNYEVQAIDLSDVAVNYLNEQAREQSLPIKVKVCDLTDKNELHFKQEKFDLVVITYYLDRSLFPLVKMTVKQGGYFFMETYFVSAENNNREISDHYKLLPNELLMEFGNWSVLFYEENEQEGRQTIFCRKE
ncbi:class I SAM-dependent methyltransferase [Bacillus sp. T3]|uniref:class I SAM-dependent methyltransferase n=1 Tax=Bacillus sp. T3 TaxID=467262 RepID=UPI0029818976|nr:methyltransferase domain-containing protein [Bacillus sp. T3]